jgi:DUF971 family protein
MAIPVEINLHQKSATLELAYADGSRCELSCEFLRVYSPSAEVRGHGPGQEVLQVGKKNVKITAIKPVGNYALQPVFDDGHDTGIYSWQYLRELCDTHDALWEIYVQTLHDAGASRDPDVQVVRIGL